MFLKVVQDICQKLGIKTFLKYKSDTICTLGITNKNDRIAFLNWIYDDATIKFERKYLKYQQCLNDYSISNSPAS